MMSTSKLNDPFVPPFYQNLLVSELLEEAESRAPAEFAGLYRRRLKSYFLTTFAMYGR
jgi:hypothetical protein